MEEIVAERHHRGRKAQELVKWQGSDILDDMWEPLGNMLLLVAETWRDMLRKQERGMADDDEEDDDSSASVFFDGENLSP